MKIKNESDILYSLEKHASMTDCIGCAYFDEWPGKCLVRLLGVVFHSSKKRTRK